jgi:hypothetical protein
MFARPQVASQGVTDRAGHSIITVCYHDRIIIGGW